MSTPPLILITGATDGIGKQTALDLARSGASVIVHGRSSARVEATCDAIRREAPAAQVHELIADLSSLASVRLAADDLRARFPKLNVLINNAGVFAKEPQRSADGHELTFAVNHLAHFLLTNLLLDPLKAAASQENPSRVITVSSIAHQRGRIRLDDLHHARSFDGYSAYAASKLANVLFSNALARRLSPLPITSNSLHPGVITTKLLRTGFNMNGASLQEGAETSVFLAVSPEVAKTSGAYFASRLPIPPAPIAHDTSLQDQLWDASERLTLSPSHPKNPL